MRISDWSSDVCSSDLKDLFKRSDFYAVNHGNLLCVITANNHNANPEMYGRLIPEYFYVNISAYKSRYRVTAISDVKLFANRLLAARPTTSKHLCFTAANIICAS